MPLQDQRAALLLRGPVRADNATGARKVALDGAETAQPLKISQCDGPVVNLIAALAQGQNRLDSCGTK